MTSSGGKRQNKKESREAKQSTKIVVRKLPASLNKQEFLDTVEPLAQYDYFRFVPADLSLGQYAFARAYINFIHPEDVYIFKEKFDGYVFVDKTGNEYQCLVEFAPYQKVPKFKGKSKKDLKTGTLDEDSDYVQFLEMYNASPEVLVTPEQCLEDIENKEKEMKVKESKTPLLEFIREKKAEKARIRDEKREARKLRDEERRKIHEDERKRRKDGKEKEIEKHDERKNKDQPKGDKKIDEKGPRNKPKTREERRREQREKQKLRWEEQQRKRKEQRQEENKEQLLEKSQVPKSVEKNSEKNTNNKKPLNRDEQAEPNNTNSGTRPKRYSDRRKEERQRRDKGQNKSELRGEENAAEPVLEVSESQSEKTISENVVGGIGSKINHELSEEELARIRQQKKEKREQREQRERERKEKRKYRDRPEIQIYRPGMGKFSSKTIQKTDEQQQPSEEKSESTRQQKQFSRSERFEEKSEAGQQKQFSRHDRSEEKPETGSKQFSRQHSGKEDKSDQQQNSRQFSRQHSKDNKEKKDYYRDRTYVTREFHRKPQNNKNPEETEAPRNNIESVPNRTTGKSYSSKRKERQQQKEQKPKEEPFNLPSE